MHRGKATNGQMCWFMGVISLWPLGGSSEGNDTLKKAQHSSQVPWEYDRSTNRRNSVLSVLELLPNFPDGRLSWMPQ